MIKMIIADDEILVREGLRDILPWNEYGVEIIAEAANGVKAYELCEQLRPDILLSDIRMPFQDGLETATKIKENGLNIKVIFFSGIQDFNYAKTAVKICAEGYILKPLEVEELKDIITKTAAKIHQERERDNRVLRLKQQLRENIGVAREKFLRDLVLGVYKKEQEILEKIEYLGRPFRPNERLIAAVLNIDDYQTVIRNSAEEDKQLLNFSVTNITDELIKDLSDGISFCKDENEHVMLFNVGELSAESQNEIFAEINACLQKHLGISTSIGIGSIANNVLEIASSYKSAVEALQFKFYTGRGSIINITDINREYKLYAAIDISDEQKRIIQCIKIGDTDETDMLINAIFQKLVADRRPNNIENIQRICAEIVFTCSRAMSDLGEGLNSIGESHSVIMDKIYRSENITGLRKLTGEIYHQCADFFAKKYSQKNEKLISEIKTIVNKRYMEDLSVNGISEMVFLTPNYVSLIFRQETGETITDYITKVRMEAAKELLKSQDLKVLDVAEMVGYSDASYFSKVFKKYTGVYPQKFRLN